MQACRVPSTRQPGSGTIYACVYVRVSRKKQSTHANINLRERVTGKENRERKREGEGERERKERVDTCVCVGACN